MARLLSREDLGLVLEHDDLLVAAVGLHVREHAGAVNHRRTDRDVAVVRDQEDILQLNA